MPRGTLLKKEEIARAGGIKAALDEAHSAASMRMTPRAITAYEAVGSLPAEVEGGEMVVQIAVENEEQLREAMGAGAEAVLLVGVSELAARRLAEIARGLRLDCVVEVLDESGRAEITEKTPQEIVGCHGPSTARPDASQNGAMETIGPLRSG